MVFTELFKALPLGLTEYIDFGPPKYPDLYATKAIINVENIVRVSAFTILFFIFLFNSK